MKNSSDSSDSSESSDSAAPSDGSDNLRIFLRIASLQLYNYEDNKEPGLLAPARGDR